VNKILMFYPLHYCATVLNVCIHTDALNNNSSSNYGTCGMFLTVHMFARVNIPLLPACSSIWTPH